MRTQVIFSLSTLLLSSLAVALPLDATIGTRASPPGRLDAAGHQIYTDMKYIQGKAEKNSAMAEDKKADSMVPSNPTPKSSQDAAGAYAKKASGQWDL